MTPDTVTLDCPAKINLALSLARRDQATGLHPLSSWMVAVDLCDTLTLRRLAPAAPSAFSIRFAADAPQAGTVDWPQEHDLAVRAHAAVQTAAGRPLPVDLSLVKRIPTCGGLGGGSSDAAGVLIALDRLFDSPIDTDAMRTIARGLGSDVPFALAALTGMPSAVVGGTGETLHPAPTLGGHLVLVMPPFGCGTAEVFRAFDRHAHPQAPQHPSVLIDLAHRGIERDLFNDLTKSALVSEPRLVDVVGAVADQSGRHVHVTGSGSTCFIVAQNTREAEALAAGLADAASSGGVLASCVVCAVQYPFAATTA